MFRKGCRVDLEYDKTRDVKWVTVHFDGEKLLDLFTREEMDDKFTVNQRINDMCDIVKKMAKERESNFMEWVWRPGLNT